MHPQTLRRAWIGLDALLGEVSPPAAKPCEFSGLRGALAGAGALLVKRELLLALASIVWLLVCLLELAGFPPARLC